MMIKVTGVTPLDGYQLELSFNTGETRVFDVTPYLDKGIFERDPFVSIDREGVGELIRIAAERGRAVRGDIKLGICGEHGGDPASIDFCEEIGLDYVSCSAYRTPIARLAAAQAALSRKSK